MNSCVYIAAVCIQNCFLRCFNSGPFSKIRSQMFYLKWSLIPNQVTYIYLKMYFLNNQLTTFTISYMYDVFSYRKPVTTK